MAIGGGFKAIKSVWQYSRQIGFINLFKALSSKNACKACAFGTGGQNGGIYNESKKGVEFCNKNVQAHLSDIRQAIPSTLFFEKSISELAQYSGKQLEELGRLTQVLYKKSGDPHFTPITYSQAFDTLEEKFKATAPERSFFYASGRSSNEAAFILQLFARLFGTNNINNCSYYCHQASGVGLNATIGTGTATVEFSDLDLADTIFVMGANPASNHPRFLKCLLKCRRRGGNVIVINPAKEPGMMRFASPSDWRSMLAGGEEVASHYLQPHSGGDLGLFYGIAKALIESESCDLPFIEVATNGFEDFSNFIQSLPWASIEAFSGISVKEIKAIAKIYAESENTIFTWSMGLTHHLNGVDNIEAVVALALLRGMIGRPGAGLLPLRGHSNIQGVGTMGFTPQLKQAVAEKLEEKLAAKMPSSAGLDSMACMQAAFNGDMDLAFVLGGNLLSANPNTHFSKQALNKIKFKCFLNPTLNQSHVHGVDEEVLIFPIKVRDEELQATTQESMFNFVRLSNGGIDRFPQLKSEVEIIQTIASSIIDKNIFDFSIFSSHKTIRKFIGDAVPGHKALAEIDQTKKEFHIGGRILHEVYFNTSDGKANFKYSQLKQIKIASDAFMLSTVRSEGQFNSIIYHEHDSYRGQTQRNVVMMNPSDIEKNGLIEGQKVGLKSDVGELNNLIVKAFDVKPGNLLTYYPEANALIPELVDSRSRTPAFKSVAVQVIAG